MYSNTRFHQLLEALPRRSVERTADRLGASRYDKSFKPYQHLVALLYGQFSGVRSLRELEVGLNAQSAHHYHLGIGAVRRSTLSDANQRRTPALFKAIVEQLMSQVSRQQRAQLQELVYLLDSTPIQLKGRGFDWAALGATYRNRGLKVHLMIESQGHNPVYLNITDRNVNDVTDARRVALEPGAVYVIDKGYYDYGWWRQIHDAGATFVTRYKRNAALDVVAQQPVEGEGILEDAHVTFRYKANRARHKNLFYGKTLRRIKVARDGKAPLVLATNDLETPAEELAELYRKRWQIELFFKWLKQHLKLKRFLGRSRNAVILQIYAAIIGYLLIWLYRARANREHSELYLLLVELRETLFIREATEKQREYRRRRRESSDLAARLQGKLAL